MRRSEGEGNEKGMVTGGGENAIGDMTRKTALI